MAKMGWNQLPAKVELLVREGEVLERPTAREIDAALDDYEARAGFRLPLSYREFVHWFGPGAFTGSWYVIAAPIPSRFRGRVGDACDLDKEQESLQDPDGRAESCDPEKLKHLVLFATTEGGDWFFWDTADVRNARTSEYGIYGHARGNAGWKVELVAQSFEAFITEVCLGPTFPLCNNQQREDVRWVHYPAWPTKPRKQAK